MCFTLTSSVFWNNDRQSLSVGSSPVLHAFSVLRVLLSQVDWRWYVGKAACPMCLHSVTGPGEYGLSGSQSKSVLGHLTRCLVDSKGSIHMT